MKYMCLLWFWMLEFCGRWILDFWMNTQNEERKVKDRILRRLSFSHTATAQHAPQLDTHGSKAIAHFCPKLPYILGAQLRQKTQSYYNWSGGMGLQEYHQKKEIYRLKCVWEAVGARKEPINFYHIKFSFILFLSFPFFSIFSDQKKIHNTWWYMLEISILISWILFWTWTWWNMMQHIMFENWWINFNKNSSKVCRLFTQF